jgi:hypothetical protein
MEGAGGKTVSRGNFVFSDAALALPSGAIPLQLFRSGIFPKSLSRNRGRKDLKSAKQMVLQ